MPKTIFTAVTPIGTTFTRTSSSMAYTHAVVSSLDVISWHTSQTLAARARNAHRHFSILNVVPVTGVEIELKKTSQAERNATRRGVITRLINQMTRSVEGFERSAAEIANAKWAAEYTRWATQTRQRIAELEAERDALLAAEAPTTLVEA